jgi:hypothetical protein
VTETTLAALGWSEWLTLAALAISGVSAFVALRADRRAGRADERAVRADRRDEERAEREREQAGAANRALLAKLHSLVEDARPQPLLFLAGLDQERAERNGAQLWSRAWELREPLRALAYESPEAVQRAVKETATHVNISIQATRNAIDAADDPQTRAELKTAAEQAYKVARECLADLDRAVEGRELGGALHAERRRA